MLSWKVHKVLIKAKLESYLGFLHSVQYGKPSLVCDFMELYRYLIDDFVLDFCRGLRAKDFVVKTEVANRNKRGKREYLYDRLTRVFMNGLDGLFESKVDVPRIKVGKRQSVETLIGEEALLFAKYLRNESKVWIPRIGDYFYTGCKRHG